jgi:hypothetical protein
MRQARGGYSRATHCFEESEVVKIVAAIFAAALLAAVSAAPATAIDPGFDLFETDPAGTQFSFREEFALPPNFFEEGSAEFQGDVNFSGVPLINFQNQDVGDADTVVQRPNAISPPGSGFIELVALNLVSTAPIAVNVRGTTQLWDVRATQSPTRRSPGQIDITQTGELGGTYSSSLTVFPKFDFVRLSDGATRTIDVGTVPGIQERAQRLTFTAGGIPWRSLCEPPALDVPGLNKGFCPGLTPDPVPVKDLNNVETSALARHKVFPAQPRLEHFQCYGTESQTRVRARNLSLIDQFRRSSVKLTTRGSLCAPVQKNAETVENRAAHLTCYTVRPRRRFPPRNVIVRNQFGSQTVRVIAPKQLCAPTAKSASPDRRPTALTPEQGIDHFTCYSASSRAVLPTAAISLRDQFGSRRTRLLQLITLCTPTQKGREPSQHPVQHLVCYSTRRTKFRARRVSTTDQFGSTIVNVALQGPLCVPSTKIVP